MLGFGCTGQNPCRHSMNLKMTFTTAIRRPFVFVLVLALVAAVAPGGAKGEESPEEIAIKKVIENVNSERTTRIAILKKQTKGKVSEKELAKMIPGGIVSQKLALRSTTELGDYGDGDEKVVELVDGKNAVVASTNLRVTTYFFVSGYDTSKWADGSLASFPQAYIAGKRKTSYGTLFVISPLRNEVLGK